MSAVVHHGEKLDILPRNAGAGTASARSLGMEGWTDDRQLLDKGQMNRLRQLSKETAGMPSPGAATCFDTLNIHTEPNRLSPSFAQVKEGEKFDIIVHRVMQRAPLSESAN